MASQVLNDSWQDFHLVTMDGGYIVIGHFHFENLKSKVLLRYRGLESKRALKLAIQDRKRCALSPVCDSAWGILRRYIPPPANKKQVNKMGMRSSAGMPGFRTKSGHNNHSPAVDGGEVSNAPEEARD
ncbi:hypothetical protein An11g02290 [Aspergillus niger]|uniref:Uncharacterized protein n=2 Tax=Aspergillus niger TaxID=5061 RepID=A2QVQ6_ASPNC|nr:hypothetical protein An11g02290 [Aspergillus niger]CAK40588.1 hypothetical protein An11g02290 [Aspergillus niger]